MKLSKLIAACASFALIAGLLTSCGNGDSANSADTDEKSELRIGLAFDLGGRGDKSFNDAAVKGLDEAAVQLDAQTTELEPSSEEDRKVNLENLTADGWNPIVAVGYSFADSLGDVAAANPDTTFAIIDSVVDAPNVASLLFAEEQGSFLVGAAAAMKSTTNHVGFIGGVESELIKRFEAGYTAGAKHVKPEITVDIKYLSPDGDFSGFSAPEKALESARAMYEAGADVIYHAAGGSGEGLFKAAAEAGEGKWAIGVDSDQYNTVDDPAQKARILTSMIKRVDIAVRDTLIEHAEGQEIGGTTQVFDLAADGVGYSKSGGFVDDISADLDALKQQIIDGTIEVPTAP